MGKNTEWQQSALALDKTGVLSRRHIAEVIGVARSTCLDFLRDYGKFKDGVATTQEVDTEYDNSRILVISDLHLPYGNKKTFEFLQYLKDKYEPTRVVQIGDECDYNFSSYHESDPDLYSAGHELKKAREQIKQLEKMFPEVDLLESNHGSIPMRKSKTAGLSRDCIKSYNDILGVGEGWRWHDDLTITLPNGQRVYFCHGRSSDGLKLSKNMSCNVVQGHFHSKFNIQYWSNPDNLFWSMQAGCLVDSKSLAMAYNKLTLDRPIIGCGLIIDSKPVLETIEM